MAAFERFERRLGLIRDGWWGFHLASLGEPKFVNILEWQEMSTSRLVLVSKFKMYVPKTLKALSSILYLKSSLAIPSEDSKDIVFDASRLATCH